MHRRRMEEFKSSTGQMQQAEDDEAFLASKEKANASCPAALAGSSAGTGDAKELLRRPFIGAWSAPALLVVLAILSLIVYSLPAPTFSEKLALLRQSWRLNAVLDESAQLRDQITRLVQEKSELDSKLTSEEARAVDLQRRLGASDTDAKSLRSQLASEQTKTSGLRGSNKDLEVKIEAERSARRQLLHKLQEVKRVEMKELSVLDEVSKNPAEDASAKKLQSTAAEKAADKRLGGFLKAEKQLEEKAADKQLGGFLKAQKQLEEAMKQKVAAPASVSKALLR